MELAKRVGVIIKAKGLRPSFVEQSLNKPPRWLWKITNGKNRILAQDLYELARLLELSVDDFFMPDNLTKSKKREG